jgi:5-methylcytosine-specific restriction endonuclease McrA
MKKQSRKTLVKNLDTIFSQYIRRKDAIDDIATCVTCGKQDHYKKLQCGHFMSRSNYSTRWDENNVGVQCYGCNISRSGEQYKFSLYLGNNLAEEMLIKSKQTVKFADVDLIDLIKFYTEKVSYI